MQQNMDGMRGTREPFDLVASEGWTSRLDDSGRRNRTGVADYRSGGVAARDRDEKAPPADHVTVGTQEPAEKALEEYVSMPKGGVAQRCQRVKRDGGQCAKPAWTDYRVCSSHGAGYATREAAGERQRPGRPITTGVYSSVPTRSYADA